jgi:catechol 2,3-dioxygenase-like lactoylglutathione lyase family enzyme
MFSLKPNVMVATRNLERAVKFYQKTLGMKLIAKTSAGAKFKSGKITFFVVKSKFPNVILEFKTRSFASAKKDLLKGGARVVQWDERAGIYLMRDPQGLVISLVKT